LANVGSNLSMWLPKSSPNSKSNSNSSCPLFSTGIAKGTHATLACSAISVPNSSPDEETRGASVGAVCDGQLERFEEDSLRVRDPLCFGGVGDAVDAEEILLEGASAIEREHLQRLVVAEG
jgi:hypothetical protein